MFFLSLGIYHDVQNFGHAFLLIFIPRKLCPKTQASDSWYLSQTSLRSAMIALQCAFLLFVVVPSGLVLISSILHDEQQEQPGGDPPLDNGVVQEVFRSATTLILCEDILRGVPTSTSAAPRTKHSPPLRIVFKKPIVLLKLKFPLQ